MKDDGKLVLLGALTMMGWSAVCIALAEEKDVPYIIGSIKVLSAYLVFIGMVQFLFRNKYGHRLSFWMKLAGPGACCLMNLYKYGQW